jgi:predicted ATPase
MLTKLRLKNLKTWGEQLWEDGIELAPITLFLGPNSAGKTSLLQLPLLLKQTFESPDRHLHLNLGGQATDLVDLGSFESVIHDHDTERALGIGMELRIRNDKDEKTAIGYEVTYISSRGAPVVQRLRLNCNDRSFAAERQGKGGYLLEAPGYAPKQFGARKDAKKTFQPERSLAFSSEAIAELGPLGAEAQDLSLRLRQAVGGIAYLGPLRERPERTYLWSGVEPGDLGKRGEFAAHALLASDNSRKRQKAGEEGGQQWLVERVSEWLAKLGVADELTLKRQGKSRHYELVVVRGKQRANLMDVGFGVSQVLPMLVMAHSVPRGTTIIAEQPEIHLHPRAQGGLAELMVAVAKDRKVQFLVETHSEHLFRRLQTLIAEEKVKAKNCRLYFIDDSEDGSANLQKLQIDEFGRIGNWPKQFFGDAIGETERQITKMLDRLAKLRGAKAL